MAKENQKFRPNIKKKNNPNEDYIIPRQGDYLKIKGLASKLYSSDPVTRMGQNASNDNAVRWLGGSRLIETRIISDFDYIAVGASGITKGSVDELAGYLGVTRKVMAEQILDISVKTLERKTPKQKLDKRTSSHAVEIARVMQHAYEVFEDEQKVKLWMNTPNKSLKGMQPVQLMDTLTGLNMIDDILGRIEEGVYS